MDEMSCERASELAPVLALNALERDRREALEAHLQRCPDCARELDGLHEVTTQFALAQPQRDPPASLGQRILAEAAADKETERQRDTETQRRSVQTGARWPISVASLVAAIAALLWAASLQSELGSAQREAVETSAQLERLRSAYDTVVDVLASPQTTVQDLQPDVAAAEAQGKVWIDHGSGQGMLMARGLPHLTEGQTYQVWLTNQAGRVSAGFLREYEDGVYYVVLRAPGKLTDYQRLGVTREPAGGSPGPTGPRLIGADI